MRKLSSLFVLLTFGAGLCLADPWCVPGWNATCNNRGTCNPTTNTCECTKLPFRCKNETRDRNAFDFHNRCATLMHGCFYELTPGGEVSQHLCNNRGCCRSSSKDGESGLGYKCSCFPGYTGKDCEKKDPCYLSVSGESKILKRNCSNHGTCQPSPSDDGSTICLCSVGYWGSECEFTDLCKVDENQKPREFEEPCGFDGECRNQSTIVDKTPVDTFTCNFNELMARDSREPDEPKDVKKPGVIDPDPRHPCWEKHHPAMPARWRNCSNHGYCIRTPPTSPNKYPYTCICRVGYFSNDCKYTDLCKIDETGKPRASGKPCNGGECHNSSWGSAYKQPFNAFTCECGHNQIGKCCEFINPCTVTPCYHNGTCSYTQSGNNDPVQKCVCPFGYSGDRCEKRDPCTVLDIFGAINRRPRDCNMRGLCSVTSDGMDFVCACKNGFFGKECDFANLCIVDEKDVPRPPNQPCTGFGACSNYSSGFPWWPKDDYNCTYKDPCKVKPCQNGGECSFTQPDPHKPPIQKCKCPSDTLGEFCQFPHPCFTMPCLNGATCILNETVAPPIRTCTCVEAYIGDNCGVVNPCYKEAHNSSDLIPRDCNKRGECMITGSLPNVTYTCNCTEGYWYTDCGYIDLCKIDQNGAIRAPNQPCYGNVCRNHSTGSVFGPSPTINSFTCECFCNRTGKYCQYPNPCKPNPCKNGGNCTFNQTDQDKPPTKNCTCKEGYIGDDCGVVSPCYNPPETGSKPLVPRECNGRGECMVVEGGTDFKCNCTNNGFWGKECNFTNLCKVDESGTVRPPEQPCNGGMCRNNSFVEDGKVNNTITCECPENRVGRRCEFINPCTSLPCKNGGTCKINHTDIDKPPTKNCTCHEEYIGDDCGVVNPCYKEAHNSSDLIPRDCNKRGECVITGSLPNMTYTCNCTKGYWYTDCAYVDLCKIEENGAIRPPNQPCYGDMCRNHSFGSVFRPNNTFTCECFCNRTGKYCQFPNPCRPNPCKNGGNCTFNQTDPDKPPTRNCTCRDEYIGDDCGLVSPCYIPPEAGSKPTVPRDCNGRGECMVVENGTDFKCNCTNGFWGKQCNFTNLCKIDESGTVRPPEQPCNGGMCRNNSFVEDGKVNNTFTCECPENRVGRRCEFVNPCNSLPCKNGGTCKINHTDPDKPPTKNCTCKEGYIGDDCGVVSPCYIPPETGSKPMVPRDCNGRGECMVVKNGTDFKCNCTNNGFWGKECNFMNLCKVGESGTVRPPEQPCNGGICHNNSFIEDGKVNNTFKCECPENRVGRRCEFINPCTSLPCKNGGTCKINHTDIDKPPTKNCTCRDGYIGDDCGVVSPCYIPPETGSKPTVPRDCNGRGECMVVENGTDFKCNCTNGFWGKQCNFTNLCKVDESGTVRPPEQPCNGGMCRNNSFVEDGKVNNTFTCECPENRVGRRCEFTNPCNSLPCKNGGTCKINHTDIDKPPTKNCTCREEYVGDTCNVISPCFHPSPSGELIKHKCNGRGECNVTEHQNNYVCRCNFGYWGKECEFIDLCKIDEDGNMRAPDKPCNGGICKNQSCWVEIDNMNVIHSNFTCQCPPNKLGKYCEFINPCVASPCLNGGTCTIHQMTPASVPTRTCSCPDGYFGDRCEQINPCYFNATYCKNSAMCVREDNYTFSCNCTKPYFQGVQCQTINLCKASPECEIFNGLEYCNPCKNGGKCEANFTDPSNVMYTCNCTESSHGGDFCEYMKGKLLIIPEDYEGTSEHVDRFTATSGYPHNYYLIALILGDSPEVDFQTGDGFSFKLQRRAFKPVDRNIAALSGIISPGAQYFAFRHTYGSCPGFCKMSGLLRNFGTISSVVETLIDVALPPGLLCVPNTGLRNVGHTVSEATEYKRTSRFVVEANLKFECFEDNWLDPTLDPGVQLSFKWILYRLSSFFPTPSAFNDVHVEMLTPTDEKYLVFDPHILLEGFYWIECRAIVRIGQQEYGNSQLSFFKIVINPPRIILKEGTTRYVDGGKDIIIDASESVDDSFPEHNPYLKYSWACETPCDQGPWEGPVLQIPEKTFQAGEMIKIRLKVSSNHARTFATEIITLHIGSGTRMSVLCVRNCDYFNPGDEVLFECVYEINGIRQPATDIALAWLPTGELTPEFNVDDEPYLTSVLLPLVNDPAPRAIICSGAKGAVSAQMEFRINMTPTLQPGGSCFITPFASPSKRGVYLVTRFKIECTTQFIDPHVPLRYSFYAQSEDKSLSHLLGDRFLLNYDTYPKTEEVFLPLGSWNRNMFVSWRIKIILKVTDDLGLSTELSGYTFVEPPDTAVFTYPTLFENLIFGDKSVMKRRFLTGDNQGVLQLQMISAYGVNRPTIINTLTTEEQHKFLSAMEHTLLNVPSHSLKLMEQKITAAHFIDHIENRAAAEVLTEVSQIMFESASQVLEYTKQREEVRSPKQIDELARASADSSSRLLKASYKLGSASSTTQSNFQMVNRRDVFDHHTDDETGRDYFFEVHDIEDDFEEEGFDEISENVVNIDVMKYAKVSHHTLLAFERAMDAALEHRGYQSEFDMSTDEVGLHAKILPDLVSDQILDAKSLGAKTEVVIPAELHGILKDRVENDLELQITEVVENPFYDDSSAYPHTPVINLVLKDSESHVPVLLENLPYPLNITLPMKLPPPNALDGARTEHEVLILPVESINEETELTIFKLDLPYDTKVDIEIDKTSSSSMIFKIIVMRDYKPTLTAMCSYPLLEVVPTPSGSYLASFSTESLKLNETPKEPYLDYYVGILVMDPNNIGVKERFRILFTRNACLHRDEDRKFWSEEGCIVDPNAEPNPSLPLPQIHCRCRHSSILAGVQFIAPHYIETTNYIDFTLGEIGRSPVVLATVCTTLVLYLIGLILCRVFDNRDKEKNYGLVIMTDLRESRGSKFYLITVVTGCNLWAGTTSAVCMILCGNLGRSKTYTLKDETLNVLKSGGVDTFLVSSDKDLGNLEKIRIWTDSSGSNPSWFCRRILVRPVGEGETVKWYFYIHQWFSITANSATIIKEVPVTTEPERKTFSKRFRENFLEQIDNVNLWLSIFRHSPALTFTRCQRLSCAFAVLTCYLLINIIFYGLLTEYESGFYDDFIFDFNIIVKSLQVALLALPFGIFIIAIFRYILPHYVPTLIIWKNAIPAKLSMENNNIFIPQIYEEKKYYPQANQNDQEKQQNAIIEFDSEEEDSFVPGANFAHAGHHKDGDNVSSSSKSNFSIPSTDIPNLEGWLEDRTKQYHAYTAKLVGASTDDEDEPDQAYPDKFISSLDPINEENRLADNLNRLGRLAIVSSVRDFDPDTFIFQGENDVPRIEALIDEQIKWRRSWKKERNEDDDPEPLFLEGNKSRETIIDEKTKSEFKKAKTTPWKEVVTTEYLQEITNMMDNEVEAKHKMQDQDNWKERTALEVCLLPPIAPPCWSLPYWWLIVAWIVCLVSIFLACFFTLYYGLHYAYLRSVYWLASYIGSFLVSVILIQPLIAVIAAVIATLIGMDQPVVERVQVIVADSRNTEKSVFNSVEGTHEDE